MRIFFRALVVIFSRHLYFYLLLVLSNIFDEKHQLSNFTLSSHYIIEKETVHKGACYTDYMKNISSINASRLTQIWQKNIFSFPFQIYTQSRVYLKPNVTKAVKNKALSMFLLVTSELMILNKQRTKFLQQILSFADLVSTQYWTKMYKYIHTISNYPNKYSVLHLLEENTQKCDKIEPGSEYDAMLLSWRNYNQNGGHFFIFDKKWS